MRIYYAVLALKFADLQDLVKKLRQAGQTNGASDAVADWLEQNGPSVYANLPEKWRPFGNQTIDQLIAKARERLRIEKRKEFVDSTSSVFTALRADNLLEVVESNVQVFFVDPCFAYASRNNFFKHDLEQHIVKEKKCCILYHPESPPEVRNAVRASWKTLWAAYEAGYPHREAHDIPAMTNFANFINRVTEEVPSPSAVAAVTQVAGYPSQPIVDVRHGSSR